MRRDRPRWLVAGRYATGKIVIVWVPTQQLAHWQFAQFKNQQLTDPAYEWERRN